MRCFKKEGVSMMMRRSFFGRVANSLVETNSLAKVMAFSYSLTVSSKVGGLLERT